MDQIIDMKYVNKWEKALKKKMGTLFTKKGIIEFFNDYTFHDDPEKMQKSLKFWKTEIDTPLF
jgi:hypothetical protein